MMSIRSSLSRLFRQTRGQDLLEYALLGSCIAVICLVGVNALGQSLGGLNTSVAGGIVNQGQAAVTIAGATGGTTTTGGGGTSGATTGGTSGGNGTGGGGSGSGRGSGS